MTKNQQNNVIIGVDPGTQVTGFGVIKKSQNKLILLECGCIKPSKNESLQQRYYIIFDALKKIIEHYQPYAIAVESQYVSKNVQSAMKLGMAKGAVLIAASSCNISVHEYSPTKAKKAVVGNGLASKEQVQHMIKLLLNLDKAPEPQDVTDALSLAICHAHTLR